MTLPSAWSNRPPRPPAMTTKSAAPLSMAHRTAASPSVRSFSLGRRVTGTPAAARRLSSSGAMESKSPMTWSGKTPCARACRAPPSAATMNAHSAGRMGNSASGPASSTKPGRMWAAEPADVWTFNVCPSDRRRGAPAPAACTGLPHRPPAAAESPPHPAVHYTNPQKSRGKSRRRRQGMLPPCRITHEICGICRMERNYADYTPKNRKSGGEVSLSKVVVRSLRARVGLVAALAALLVLTAGAGVFAQQTVVIGTLGPLTGDYASYGVSVANGVELAVNEANASGQYNYVFRVQKEDTRGDSVQAVNAINKLIEL